MLPLHLVRLVQRVRTGIQDIDTHIMNENELFKTLDIDKNGVIDKHEFMNCSQRFVNEKLCSKFKPQFVNATVLDPFPDTDVHAYRVILFVLLKKIHIINFIQTQLCTFYVFQIYSWLKQQNFIYHLNTWYVVNI